MNFEYLFNQQDGICWLCDKPMQLTTASRDHVIPKSKGGDSGYANIRLAHRICNSLRGSVDQAVAKEYVLARLAGRSTEQLRPEVNSKAWHTDQEIVISRYGYVERRKGTKWSITIPIVTKP